MFQWFRSAVKWADALAGWPELPLTLSQVSHHVCLSIVSGQQLPLQGSRLQLNGMSHTARIRQTSGYRVISGTVFLSVVQVWFLTFVHQSDRGHYTVSFV